MTDPSRAMRRNAFGVVLGFGGVCAGFANYLSWDITMVRLGYVLLVLFTGVPLILYFIGWAVMPRNDTRPMLSAPYVG